MHIYNYILYYSGIIYIKMYIICNYILYDPETHLVPLIKKYMISLAYIKTKNDDIDAST